MKIVLKSNDNVAPIFQYARVCVVAFHLRMHYSIRKMEMLGGLSCKYNIFTYSKARTTPQQSINIATTWYMYT